MMAKRRANKAAKIRAMFDQLGPKAKPKEVIAALAAKRIKVTSPQVSNVKAKMGGSTGGRKLTGGYIDLDALLEVKKLVDKVGLNKAQAALSAFAKLL